MSMSGCGTNSVAQCKQPTIAERLNECLGLAQQAKEIASSINVKLFKNQEVALNDCQKNIEPYSIETRIEEMHERLEAAVKELEIINGKLG